MTCENGTALCPMAAMVSTALLLLPGSASSQTDGRQGARRPRGPEPIVREVQLVAQFDQNGDKHLDAAERQGARDYLDAHPELRPPRRRTRLESGTPGPQVSPYVVNEYRGIPLYDPGTLRTLFLQFPRTDWEQELAAFHGTDVDLPAMMIFDGRSYPEVGVHFRGHNSFLAVPEGAKRALTLSPDFADKDQRLLGHRGLHLLNAYQDPSLASDAWQPKSIATAVAKRNEPSA